MLPMLNDDTSANSSTSISRSVSTNKSAQIEHVDNGYIIRYYDISLSKQFRYIFGTLDDALPTIKGFIG